MIACPGAWKNFEELEEELSLAELNQILDSHRKAVRENQKFLAAIKGIDLDKGKGQSGNTPEFEEIKKRVQAKLAGVDEEALALREAGIKIEEWE